jgi:metallothiol transferase
MIKLKSGKPSHVVINVVDLDRSFKFYHDVLGLEREEKSDNSVTFTEYGLVIQQASEDAKVPKKSSLRHQIGLSHMGFLCEDVIEAAKALRLADATIVNGPIRKGGIDYIYFLDPDGNQLELHTA